MHRDILGRINSQANFVAANIDDCHDDIVTDHDALVAVSGQDQHRWLLPFLDSSGAVAGLQGGSQRQRAHVHHGRAG
jgi:hypothetical protein